MVIHPVFFIPKTLPENGRVRCQTSQKEMKWEEDAFISPGGPVLVIESTVSESQATLLALLQEKGKGTDKFRFLFRDLDHWIPKWAEKPDLHNQNLRKRISGVGSLHKSKSI